MSTDAARPPPHDIRNLHDQAVELLGRRQLGPAQQACLQILKADPRHADAHFLLGMIAMELGRPGNALEFIDKAIGVVADRAEYHAHRARCLALLKRDREAVAAADRALALGSESALTLDTIGVVFSRVGEHERAVKAFGKAVERAPDTPGYQFNLASSLKFLGRFDEAERALEAAIDASPRFYKAHASLSQLRRQTREHNHIERLEGLIGGCRGNVSAELQLRHALAKEYEDLGDYDRAFEHLAAGNARRRLTLDYLIERDERLFQRMRELFSDPAGAPSCDGGDPNDEPIFVVGMPRTGTTLVDRILGSHPDVTSAGELQNFPILVKRAAGTRSTDVLDLETLDQAIGLDMARLGRAYVDSTRPRTGETPHFTDKMPLNFLYIGFIRRALPNARIICLRRNPLDTCLSNFRQLFALKFSYYNYAYDLLDTGRYYVLFDRLMRHWRKMFPGAVLEVRYESIVAEQETETRRILEFCGLDWCDDCLTFERNAAPVATASSVQVRQPLYAHAAGRWQRYGEHLGPLRDLLESEGIEPAG